MKPVALSIAGSDPSGGAGIQADLKTFHQFGVYGEAVITLITVQNTVGVGAVECLAPSLVARQLAAVLEDIPPKAAKTGALGNRDVVQAVAEAARDFGFPLVVDPVMISKHGAPLLDEDARSAVLERLLPYAHLVTPNLYEAQLMTGVEVRDIGGMIRAGRQLLELGPAAALIKGGHLEDTACDVLLERGREPVLLTAERVHTQHTHGTGCTYSAAITACLAQGDPVLRAVRRAKAYITAAIRTNPALGAGQGPVNHHAPTV